MFQPLAAVCTTIGLALWHASGAGASSSLAAGVANAALIDLPTMQAITLDRCLMIPSPDLVRLQQLACEKDRVHCYWDGDACVSGPSPGWRYREAFQGLWRPDRCGVLATRLAAAGAVPEAGCDFTDRGCKLSLRPASAADCARWKGWAVPDYNGGNGGGGGGGGGAAVACLGALRPGEVCCALRTNHAETCRALAPADRQFCREWALHAGEATAPAWPAPALALDDESRRVHHDDGCIAARSSPAAGQRACFMDRCLQSKQAQAQAADAGAARTAGLGGGDPRDHANSSSSSQAACEEEYATKTAEEFGHWTTAPW